MKNKIGPTSFSDDVSKHSENESELAAVGFIRWLITRPTLMKIIHGVVAFRMIRGSCPLIYSLTGRSTECDCECHWATLNLSNWDLNLIRSQQLLVNQNIEKSPTRAFGSWRLHSSVTEVQFHRTDQNDFERKPTFSGLWVKTRLARCDPTKSTKRAHG